MEEFIEMLQSRLFAVWLFYSMAICIFVIECRFSCIDTICAIQYTIFVEIYVQNNSQMLN